MWKELVESISSDMEHVDEFFRPTHFWRMGAEYLQQDLDTYGITKFRSLPSTLGYFVPTYLFDGMITNQQKYAQLVSRSQDIMTSAKAKLFIADFLSGENQARADFRVYLASQSNRTPYTDNFSESKVGEPLEHFEFEGRNYSRSSLNYLLGLNFLKQHVSDISVKTVVEIGGGFGSLGEILLSDERNDTFYINVDIPPTCIFSTFYLQSIFGQSYVADYNMLSKQSLNIDNLRKAYKAAIICPWQLPNVEGQIDLFVNFISFQEMEPHIVQNYLNEIARLQSSYILLRNLREGKQLALNDTQVGVKEAIKSDDYNRFLPDYDLIATNVLPFGYQTIDGFHSELRLYQRKVCYKEVD
jgi:putative sugar O-methyltransferase